MEQRDATQPEAAAEERDQERPSIIPPPKVGSFLFFGLVFCDLMWWQLLSLSASPWSWLLTLIDALTAELVTVVPLSCYFNFCTMHYA